MSCFYYFAKYIAYIPLQIMYPTKFIGDYKLKQKKLLITMNHRSLMDSLLLGLNVTPKIHFMAKAEFWDKPLLKPIFNGFEITPVKRGQVDISATRKALTYLKNNKIFTLFPEGGRNDSDHLKEFKNGAAMFAIKAQAPIKSYFICNKPRPFRRTYIMVSDEYTLEQFYNQRLTQEVLDEATKIIEQNYIDLENKYAEYLNKKRKKH